MAVAGASSPRRGIDPVGGIYFWFFLSIGAVSPFIYVYYQRIGLGNGDIKLLATLAPLIGLLTQPLWGALADLLHARRAILVTCLLGNALTCLAYLATTQFVLLLGVVTLFALFQGGVLPLVNSSAIAAGGRETGFGPRRLWGTLSFVIAATVAGTLTTELGLTAVFPLAAFGLAGAALVALRLPPAVVRRSQNRLRFLAGLRLLWRDRACRWFVLALTVLGMTIEGNFVTFGLMWVERGGSDAALGLAWSLAALGEVPLLFWGTRFLTRLRPLTLLILASLFALLRWLVILLVADWRLLMLAQPLHALMYVCYLWGAVHFVDSRSRAAVKNTGQTLFAVIAYGVAMIAGNWLGGHVYEHAGTAWVYAVYAGIALLAAALFAVARRAAGKES